MKKRPPLCVRQRSVLQASSLDYRRFRHVRWDNRQFRSRNNQCNGEILAKSLFRYYTSAVKRHFIETRVRQIVPRENTANPLRHFEGSARLYVAPTPHSMNEFFARELSAGNQRRDRMFVSGISFSEPSGYLISGYSSWGNFFTVLVKHDSSVRERNRFKAKLRRILKLNTMTSN